MSERREMEIFYRVGEDLRVGRHVPYRDSVWRRTRTPANTAVEVE